MKTFGIIFSLVLLGAANLFAVTEGLSCYTCYAENSVTEYTPVDSGIQGSNSCKFGNSPNSTLQTTCPVEKDDDGKELPSVCTLLYAERPIPDNVQIAKVTVRGCIHPIGPLLDMKNGCYNKTYEEMATYGMESTLSLISSSFGEVPDTTLAFFCHCKNDDCNAGVDSAGKVDDDGGKDGGGNDGGGDAGGDNVKLSLFTGVFVLVMHFLLIR